MCHVRLILALAVPASIDLKRKRAFGEAWNQFAAVTPNVPRQAFYYCSRYLNGFPEIRKNIAIVLQT